MSHVAIGQAEADHPGAAGQVAVGQLLQHGGAEAPGQHVLLHRDEHAHWLGDQPLDQVGVEGLGEAGVGHVGLRPRSAASRSAAPSATDTPNP